MDWNEDEMDKNTIEKSSFFVQLGNIKRHRGDIKRALEYYGKALAISENERDITVICQIEADQ